MQLCLFLTFNLFVTSAEGEYLRSVFASDLPDDRPDKKCPRGRPRHTWIRRAAGDRRRAQCRRWLQGHGRGSWCLEGARRWSRGSVNYFFCLREGGEVTPLPLLCFVEIQWLYVRRIGVYQHSYLQKKSG